MKHLIISREYPPSAYAPGGIGAYVSNITRLLVERGETVHIICQRWRGAPEACQTFHDGKLIVHRIGDEDIPARSAPDERARLGRELKGLKKSAFPIQWFGWHAAFLAEQLIEQEGIDVVEAQDWEAPLFHFLLRRAAGMGPRRHPPCIVHLHSTSTVIRHFNGPLSTPPPFVTMKRMEDFSIRSADALLCPSRYFADQCREHYGLSEDAITVIHLPVGFTPALERDVRTWDNGSICFVGRLEPRKGIVEWMEAAARVAQEDSNVRFDFVGDDVWGMRPLLLRRLAPGLRPRFCFHGSKTREELPLYLGAARAAVVPSRWENFPNVCIEAMSSGLPVIATSLGGMIELLEDGRTGWLAPDQGIAGMVEGLADALRRCLAASADERAAMGQAAAQAVRATCDNQGVVEAHLRFRGAVAERGAHRSLRGACGSPAGARTQVAESQAAAANIVIRAASIADAEPVLQSLQAQSLRPQAVAIVHREARSGDAAERDEGGIVFEHRPDCVAADAWNAGFTCLGGHSQSGFWLFLDKADRLSPTCLERMARAFERQPDAGIAAPWTERSLGPLALEAPLCPEPFFQLIGNDVPPASAFRAEALAGEPPFRSGLPREYDVWQLANAVIARGWSALVLPEALAARSAEKPIIAWPEATALRAIRAEVLKPLGALPKESALDLVDTFVSLPGTDPNRSDPATSALRGSIHRKLGLAVRHPRWTAQEILRESRASMAVLGWGAPRWGE